MSVLNKLAEFVGKYLTYIVFAVVVAAFFFPQGFTWAASQTVLLLSIIMFGMGMTLRASDFALVLSRPKEVFFGCVGQFTIMPFLAYVLTVGFELPPELAIGMILLGTTPGGTASNVMTYLAKGDVTLSVCLTTATTLLAPLLTPFLTWMLAGQWVEVSFLAMLKSVSQVILLPIVLGILVHKAVGDKLVVKYSKLLVLVSAFSVLSIMGAMVALNGETILRLGWVMVLVVVLQNFGGPWLDARQKSRYGQSAVHHRYAGSWHAERSACLFARYPALYSDGSSSRCNRRRSTPNHRFASGFHFCRTQRQTGIRTGCYA